MKESLRLGRIAGVAVGINWSVLVIFTLITVGLAAGRFPILQPDLEPVAYAVAGLAAGIAFFLSLLAHELSHAIVARRNGVGVDVNRHYVELSRDRLLESARETSNIAQVLHGDARRIAEALTWDGIERAPRGEDGLPLFDFIMTSPPYWNMLRKSRGGVESTHKQRAAQGLATDYGDQESNLGTVGDYEDFIEQLGMVFDGCARLLRPQKYMVVVAQNVRVPEGHVRPLAWDLARRVSRSLSFQGERIWCQDSKRLGIWGYPTTFVPNYHHHYCLIFRRQD